MRKALLYLLTIFALVVMLAPAGPGYAAGVTVDPRLSSALSSAGATDLLKVVVTFDGQPDSALLSTVRSGVTKFQALSALNMALVVGTPSQVSALQTLPGVRSLYMDRQLQYFLHESVPLIGADKAWVDPGVTGKGVGVAVLDSGVDATHPDLPYGSKVVQNIKIVGDDETAPGVNAILTDLPNSDSSSGHGTHVAGTIGGLGNASKTNSSEDIGGYGYFTGVAPGASLIGIGTGDGIFIFTALSGFNWIMEHKDQYNIGVISNSWGTSGPFDENDPINVASKVAHDAGITVVFASGNAGPGSDTLNPYSVAPWVIGVAAGNKDGKTIADFSSRGKYGDPLYHPTITAPGVGIVSTRANNTVLPVLGATDDVNIRPEWIPYYTTMSGTSMATPHVSGVVALIKEANPSLSPDVIKRVLVNTATPMPDYQEFEVGAGYVNAYAAVKEAQSIRNVRAYKDPKTGKTIQVYVKETTYTGTVSPAAASYNSISVDNHNFTVDANAILAEVTITWDNPVNDMDLFVYDPTGASAGASQNVQALTLEGKEGVSVSSPVAGTWKATAKGWLNAPQDYQGTVVQYLPVK